MSWSTREEKKGGKLYSQEKNESFQSDNLKLESQQLQTSTDEKELTHQIC